MVQQGVEYQNKKLEPVCRSQAQTLKFFLSLFFLKLLHGNEQPNETVEKLKFSDGAQEAAPDFEFERAVGQVVGVWKGLDQRPKYVNFADIVNQSE